MGDMVGSDLNKACYVCGTCGPHVSLVQTYRVLCVFV